MSKVNKSTRLKFEICAKLRRHGKTREQKIAYAYYCGIVVIGVTKNATLNIETEETLARNESNMFHGSKK